MLKLCSHKFLLIDLGDEGKTLMMTTLFQFLRETCLLVQALISLKNPLASVRKRLKRRNASQPEHLQYPSNPQNSSLIFLLLLLLFVYLKNSLQIHYRLPAINCCHVKQRMQIYHFYRLIYIYYIQQKLRRKLCLK